MLPLDHTELLLTRHLVKQRVFRSVAWSAVSVSGRRLCSVPKWCGLWSPGSKISAVLLIWVCQSWDTVGRFMREAVLGTVAFPLCVSLKVSWGMLGDPVETFWRLCLISGTVCPIPRTQPCCVQKCLVLGLVCPPAPCAKPRACMPAWCSPWAFCSGGHLPFWGRVVAFH